MSNSRAGVAPSERLKRTILYTQIYYYKRTDVRVIRKKVFVLYSWELLVCVCVYIYQYDRFVRTPWIQTLIRQYCLAFSLYYNINTSIYHKYDWKVLFLRISYTNTRRMYVWEIQRIKYVKTPLRRHWNKTYAYDDLCNDVW